MSSKGRYTARILGVVCSRALSWEATEGSCGFSRLRTRKKAAATPAARNSLNQYIQRVDPCASPNNHTPRATAGLKAPPEIFPTATA